MADCDCEFEGTFEVEVPDIDATPAFGDARLRSVRCRLVGTESLLLEDSFDLTPS